MIHLISRKYQIDLTYRQIKLLKNDEHLYEMIKVNMNDHTRGSIADMSIGNLTGLDDGLIVELYHNDFTGFEGLDHITPEFIVQDLAVAVEHTLK